MSHSTRLLVGALIAVITLCCDASSTSSTDPRIGNLGDRSYGGLLGKAPRTSANGETLEMTRFKGRFVWADYAAPWCSTCTRQVSEIHQARGRAGSEVEFMTVMTSDMGGYGDPASQATARSWSQQHGIPPDRVVAADLTSMAVPRHLLFSPDGQMIFEWKGFFSAEQIQEVLAQRMDDWRAWKASGTRAHWMTGSAS